jgi:radical SAM family uncharacterized protein/radical SAM-linked protein
LIESLRDRLVSDALPEVGRPGRYAGNEVNLVVKPNPELRFLLCFPDLYEIGMSNLGLRILLHVLGRDPRIGPDLAFAPWPDMESFMRRERIPLYGIGSGRKAADFEILGFSLQHELQYTNTLNMLDLAGIPVRSADRGEGDPLVVAGGPCAFNPEVMRDFIDAFAVGDGETVVVEMAGAVREGLRSASGRGECLRRLAALEGVYVPEVHGRPAPGSIRRRVESALRPEDFPFPPVVPLIPITHDRLTLEIMRGCTRGCRFCSAGMTMRPVRERSVESAEHLARAGISASGWDEVSLVSLSSSDYSGLEALVGRLTSALGPARVSISLPSMRPGTFNEELARLIASTKKTGLTFAPEAGTDRLRRAINKDIDEGELYATVETAFRHGWDAVKLYFMVGLPGETDEDIEGLIAMVRSVEAIGRVFGKRKRITVSLSPFVPRPHTPFQWERQETPEGVLRRINYLRRQLSGRRLKLKWRDPYMARLEGLLARGDRSVGRLVECAWRSGSRFESWTDQFRPEIWDSCLEGSGVEAFRILGARDPAEPLPWDYIFPGVSPDFLRRERRRAESGRATPDCRTAECTDCGACADEITSRYAGAELTGPAGLRTGPSRQDEHIAIRIRVRYAKLDDMRLTSHLDVGRCIQRGLRRAGIPVCFSSGHTPHPRVAFGPPLPLGMVGESEYFDVQMWRVPREDWLVRVNQVLPSGLQLLEAQLVAARARSLTSLVTAGAYEIRLSGPVPGAELAEDLQAALGETCRPLGKEVRRQGEETIIGITAGFGAEGPRPEKLLDRLLRSGGYDFRLARKGLYYEAEGELRTPLSAGPVEDSS